MLKITFSAIIVCMSIENLKKQDKLAEFAEYVIHILGSKMSETSSSNKNDEEILEKY